MKRHILAVAVMTLLLLSIYAPVSASLAELEGRWVNVDAATRGITRIIIDFTSGQGVHAFGSCTPTDCDWGIAAESFAYGPDVSANLTTDALAATARFDFGFSTTILVIQPSGVDQLTVQSFTHFLDNSGRTDYTATETFRREGPPPPTPVSDCSDGRLVDFEDISLSSRITNFGLSHTSFQPANADIAAHEFFWSSGLSTVDGYAEIGNGGLAGGSGHEVQVNNVNLSVSAGFGQTMTYLQLQFGEFGGNLNLQLNDQFVNFDNFADIHNTSVGGVSVNLISGGLGNDQGVIEFTGAMNEQTFAGTFGFGQFIVGGQELWIDNICYTLQ